VRARYARYVVALGVAALLLSDVWRLPHLLFSRHVVCREHGELVHQHEEAASRAPGEPIAEIARASTADPALHGHEHCSTLATSARGVAVVLAPQGQISLLAAEAGRELASFDADAARPLTVLVYAPKQGPPA
jgi:hypothetical protein